MGKKKNFEEANVPLSAMIDVVFLLLIYFVVTQKPVIEDVYIPADLPAPPAQPPPTPPPPPFKITVIEGSGSDYLDQYAINGRRYSLREIESMLSNMQPTDVIITCDPNSLHRKLIKLMDTLQVKGFNKFSMVDDKVTPFRP